MPDPIRYRLRKLRINEISLVDVPANPGAQVLFYKRGENVTIEQQLADANAKIVELEKKLDDATKALASLPVEKADLTKAKDDLTKEKNDLITERDALKVTVSDLEKKLNPPDPNKDLPQHVKDRIAAVEKSNEDMVKKLAQMEDERIEKAFIDKAGELKHLTVDAAKFGGVLKKFATGKSEATDVDEIFRILKAANEAVEKSKIFEISGGTGELYKATDAESELKAKAKEIQKAENGKITFEKAYDLAMTENPALYRRYLDESKSSATH